MHEQAYQLCMEIEELPASEQQTKCSVMAANLLREVEALEAKLNAAKPALLTGLRLAIHVGVCGPENKIRSALTRLGVPYEDTLLTESITTSEAREATPRPLDEWSEEDGPALWWKFPINEPPYCGSPLYSDWPGYHTHWTRIPMPIVPGEEE